MAIVKKLGVLSVAKIYALMLAVLGLIEGILLAISTALGYSDMMGDAYSFAAWGYWSIIIMPIAYAILGFIIGSIGAWLYNRFASLVGGVDVELEMSDSSAAKAVLVKKARK